MKKQRLIQGTLVAAAIFAAAGVLGWIYADQAAPLLMPSVEGLENIARAAADLGPDLRSPALVTLIFLKNLSVAGFLVLLGYIVLALPAFLVLVVNGGLIGVVAHSITAEGFPIAAFFAGLVLHGIFELPAIFLAAGFAFAVVTGRFARQGLPTLRTRLGFILKTIIPLLLIAAVIEVYLTPLAIARFL